MASGVPLLAPRAAPGLYGDVNVDGRWFKVRSICGERGNRTRKARRMPRIQIGMERRDAERVTIEIEIEMEKDEERGSQRGRNVARTQRGRARRLSG